MPAYAGIGSRRTPPDVLWLMSACARRLCARGWTLRSGGAPGADDAFMIGAHLESEKKGIPANIEIFYPWPKFGPPDHVILDRPSSGAWEIAEKYHPTWRYLKRTIRPLIARNTHQILGRDLRDPVMMIVCWTPDGSLDGRGPDSGGTGQALRVAAGEAPDAEVFNLARPDHRKRVEGFTL